MMKNSTHSSGISGEPAVAASAPDPRWALAVAVLGSGIAFLDGTVVNVALPVIQTDLGMTVDLAQWVVESYALMLASLVLVGGALGDRYGRRRMFSSGIAVFSLASMACGLAPDAMTLVVARGVQGVGAAMLVPGSLALISAAYPVEKRGKAIGTWSSFSAITAAIGPVAGGWVVANASWRWLFFFNVPIAIVILALASARVAETRDDTVSGRTDWPGAALVTGGLGMIVYALIDAGSSWHGTTTVLFVAGLLLLVMFVVVESRSASPMVSLALFRSRMFSGTNILTFLLYAALSGTLFFLPFNLIQVQQYSPAAAGASLLPFVLLVSLLSRWSGGLAGRFGARPLLIAGPILAGVGFGLLAIPGIGGSYWTTYFPGVLTLGIGMGLTAAPLTTAVMGSVDSRHAGVASGINNAVARSAGLLAVAAFGVVLLARFGGALEVAIGPMSLSPDVTHAIEAQRGKLAAADLSSISDPNIREAVSHAFAEAYVTGFRTLMIAGAVLAALSAVAAVVLVRGTGNDGRSSR